MIAVYTATEDELGESLADCLVQAAGGSLEVGVRMRRQGCGYLRKKLPELIRLAPHIPVLLLTDQDKSECAPGLIHHWLGKYKCPDNLLFRVVVRESESWLLADHTAFSDFFSVPAHHIPDRPDDLDDPKATMLSLIWRHSPRSLRADMAAQGKGGLRQGLAYNARCREFVDQFWRIDRAIHLSESLDRAYRRVLDLARRLT